MSFGRASLFLQKYYVVRERKQKFIQWSERRPKNLSLYILISIKHCFQNVINCKLTTWLWAIFVWRKLLGTLIWMKILQDNSWAQKQQSKYDNMFLYTLMHSGCKIGLQIKILNGGIISSLLLSSSALKVIFAKSFSHYLLQRFTN